MKLNQVLPGIVIIIMFAAAFFLYPQLEEPIIIHWDAKGDPDGYASKFTGLFLIPLLTLLIYLLFLAIPKIAVFKQNIMSFKEYYRWFIVVFVIFMAFVYFTTLLQNIGTEIPIQTLIIPAIAILMYIIGMFLPHTKRNFFIGIRTPWTLSNDKVWKKTHQVAAPLFKVYAVTILLGLLVPDYILWFILLPLAFLILFILVYSYKLYAKIS